MLAITDAMQLQLISGGPAGGGGLPPGAPGWGESHGSMIGFEGGPMAVVSIGPPGPSSDHTYFDGAMIATVGRFAGVAATGFVEGFLVGAGVTSYAPPVAAFAGLAVGIGTAYAATRLLKWDHGIRVNYQ